MVSLIEEEETLEEEVMPILAYVSIPINGETIISNHLLKEE